MRYEVSNAKILSICANEDVYVRGENYYRAGKLISFHAKRTADETVVCAAVKGNYRNYEVSLKFEESGALAAYACSCASQSIWEGACKHVAAALFALSDGWDPSFYGKTQNRALIDGLEHIIFREIDEALAVGAHCVPENSRLAKLIPRFHCACDGAAYLSFRVGYSRLYTIKNLSKLLTAVEKGQTVRYGNGLEFNHAPASFNRASRRWLSFLRHEAGLYAEIRKDLHSHQLLGCREDARVVPLSQRNMDAFFDLCEDGAVDSELDFLDEPKTLKLVTGLPKLQFGLAQGASELTLTGPGLRYRLLRGQRYFYLLTAAGFHRMQIAEAKLLSRLLEALGDTGRIVFEGSDRKRFASVVLPKLRSMGLVAAAEAAEAPPLTAKMYFDAEGEDSIVGRVVFEYGDERWDAFDSPPPESDLLRDIPAEYALKRQLQAVGFVPDVSEKLYRLQGVDNMFAFLGDDGIQLLNQKGAVYITDALRRKIAQAPAGSIGVRLRGGLLKVYVQGADFTLAELAEALESYCDKKKYHRLRDGRLLSLADKATVDMANTLAALDADPKDIQKGELPLPVYRAPYVEGLAAEQDSAFRKLMQRFHAQDSFAVPEALRTVLRPYQVAGYQWLKNLAACGFGGILADDMGLGKTLQVIAILQSEAEDADKETYLPSLVVAPTSLLYNWQQEIKKFAPGLKAVCVAGAPEKREALLQSGADVFITTYDTLKRDEAMYQDKKFCYVIADEAQNIKNPATKNAKTIKAVTATHRIALTGTPIENTLSELWSLFDFVMPGYLYTAPKFARLYEVPIVRDEDKEKALRLKRQIAPFILRRTKERVLQELPPKTETTLLAEMLPEQRKIYTAHLLKTQQEFAELLAAHTPKGSGHLQILAELTRLRQICCHPALCAENYRGGSGKLALAMETLQIALESGHRCLLFSQFTEMLAILRRAIQKAGMAYFYLDGATPAAERMESVQRFNGGERDVFLISLKAGGTGLNLVGADIVIHYDPWWNPSVMDQASDRVYRMGQKRAVQVFNLVAKDSLEERILELQAKKRKLIDAVLDESNENGAPIQLLTEAEIQKLLL